MLGMLVREHGTEVSDYELVGIGGLLLLAGHETTSNMLSLGTIALLQHPDQLAAVRDDPDAVGPAIEELLRYLSVVQNAIPRITTSDVEVGGVSHSGRASRDPLAAGGQSRSPLHPRAETPSTSAAARPVTWHSATVCTTASGRRWRGWKCGSLSRHCCAASHTWRSTKTLSDVPFRELNTSFTAQSR